jgi:chromosome segregation ATPase
MALENLKLLEAKINGFLARHEQVRNERETLLFRLNEREREHSALLDRLQQYEQERNEMRALLEKILSRFDGLDLQ